MVFSKLLKSGMTSCLIALSITLQLTACNSGTPHQTSDAPDGSESFESPSAMDIRLSWVAPSEREDNKPMSLADIAGYKIYYGLAPDKFKNSVNIKDGTAGNYTFKNFRSGTYYFSLTTYDTDGRESRRSPAVRIVI